MKTPLLVIILRRGEAADTELYAKVLRETFVGPVTTDVTALPKELLQAAELREFDLDGATPIPRPLLESAERVLIIVLDARSDAVGARTLNDTEQALTSTPSLAGRPFLVVNVMLKASTSLFDPALHGGQVVRLGLADLEERDLRMPFLALYALHNALRLFVSPTAGVAPKPARLFFSHAKRDGVPLTTAVLDWMKHLKGFDAFYDTQNLDLDGDIETQLQDAVASGIVVVFRTDIFDQRYWCQKEVLWAEQHGRPVITVDARWQIEHSASVISFDSTPVVRIPDGNLVRIFAAALVESLRIELFRARATMHETNLVDARMGVIPRYPSLVSLHETCATLASQAARHKFVVYPNPALPSVMSRAADEIARALVPGCSVLSLDEFRLVV
jgi:hypothetical protein